jgi:hypothetical protein
MHRLDFLCDDDENPSTPPPLSDPDPLTTIFEWIERDDDAHEGATQAPIAQYPAPQE